MTHGTACASPRRHTAVGFSNSPIDGSARPRRSNGVRLSFGAPAPGSQPTPGTHSGSQIGYPPSAWLQPGRGLE